MIAWMLYTLAISAALGLAALAVERALGLYHRPTRWAWVAAMVGSIAVPAVLLVTPRAAPTGAADVAPLTAIEAPVVAPIADRIPEASASAWPHLGPYLLTGWGLASFVLLVMFGRSAWRLRHARRRWRPAEIAGQPVLESDSVGPAVVGVLRTRIAVPAWIRELDEDLQALVLEHERSHQAASDPLLLWLGVATCVAVPWCAPLWWQLRRLRLAIEVDCDRRLLAGGVSLARYGSLLLEVGRRSGGRPFALVGLFEPRSFLERRIRVMTLPPPRYRFALALAFIAGIVPVMGLTATLPAPEPLLRSTRSPNPGPPVGPEHLIVTVGTEHGDVRTIEELARLDPHRRDLEGYRIHGVEAVHETSHGCGGTYDREDGVLQFHVDPGDRDRPLAGYCYLLLASSLEGVEVRTRVARFDSESGFRQASYDSPPECDNCSPASAMAALERAGVAACRFRVQPYLEADGSVRTLDILASDDRCVPVLRRWAEEIRWTAGRQRGEPVDGWASPVSGGREGSVDVIPTTAPVPVDTPPRFERTSFDQRPVCVENCDQNAILAALLDGGVESATCDAVIGIRIGVEGTVTGTDVLKSDQGCEAALTDWAESTRWTPARRDGDPIPVWIAQPIRLYPEPESAESTRRTGTVHVEAETDPDAIAKTTLRRAMVAQEMYRAENGEYADAFELDLSPPRTVTVEVRSDGEGYVLVARHDHGTAAFCASAMTNAIVEGTDC